MAPKPKHLFVIQKDSEPVAVFRDKPAANEFMRGLRDDDGVSIYRVLSVRLYEYRVGKGTESE